MIDTHCHLEQPDYKMDRGEVIKRCKGQLNAVITSCANPEHFDLTKQLTKQHKGFIFATASIHPSYVKKFGEEEIYHYIERIRAAKESLVAIGETGLDYNWVREVEWRKKQQQLFIKFVELARHLKLPLVIHSRDATREVVELLELHGEMRVQMHMFTKRSLLKRVIDNGWMISINTLLLRSKDVKKIVRDCPLEQLMLETDSPWLGIDENGELKPKDIVRNEPTAVSLVAERIAEIKKVAFKEVDEETTNNAKKFFKLNF